MNIGWVGFLQILTGMYFFMLMGGALGCMASKTREIGSIGSFVFHMVICGGLIGFLLI